MITAEEARRITNDSQQVKQEVDSEAQLKLIYPEIKKVALEGKNRLVWGSINSITVKKLAELGFDYVENYGGIGGDYYTIEW